MTIMIAGSTGELGRALVKVGLDRGHRIVALARRTEKLAGFESSGNFRSVRAEVTRANELRGVCENVDVVMSALGITRQRDRVTFRDVDYQANVNLLNEAKKAGVQKFMFTSGFGIDRNLDNAMFRAKKDFELALQSSGIAYVIIRPTGFFSDMMMILGMAKDGRVYLLGSGSGRINPIDLADLAEYYYGHLDDTNAILEVGGPESFSFEEIAEMAFKAIGAPEKIVHIPVALIAIVLPLVRLFSLNAYAELQAFTRIMIAGA
jgi:uncharacterized protein YbjT (DUF2867 family)